LPHEERERAGRKAQILRQNAVRASAGEHGTFYRKLHATGLEVLGGMSMDGGSEPFGLKKPR
jgi:hypothetical protein